MSEIIGMSKIMEQCRIFSQSEEGSLPSVWRRVVSKIKSPSETVEKDEYSDKRIPLGERLASNTRVLDLNKGVLIIESDHPGWIQYLKFYQKFILKGLEMESPDLKIRSLAFRLKNQEADPVDVYEQALQKAKEEYARQQAKTEQQVEKFYESAEKEKKAPEKDKKPESQLPPELLAKIDSIRQSMLTKDEK
ncbi:MAG: DUF721 domain-containing protein [Treponema sp.]|nr:DUF721 domain-containing protein [Treponema sp.]